MAAARAKRRKVSAEERRLPRPQRVLRKPRAAAFFSGVRRPLAAALNLLSQHSGEINASWKRLLRRLAPGREEFEALSQLSLQAHYRHLRVADYEAYAEALRAQGQSLARQGVPEDHAIAALAFQLESCLARLLEVDGRALALSLVRLTGAIQRFTLLGFGSGRSESWRRIDDKERLKLSRDLHDDIGADLVVLKLYIEMIALELVKGNVAPAGAKLQEALALVGRAIDSVRRLTLDLGPVILEQIGFLGAVRLYARQFSERTGIRVEFQEAGLPEGIPATHETALYRALQGALSNVAKHSRARNVRISLGGFRGAVAVMVVEDDGAGFDPVRVRHGFGLTAMQDRIGSLGGRLHVGWKTVRGARGRSGTRIEIDLPLKSGDS